MIVVIVGPFLGTPSSNDVGHLGKGFAIGALHALWIFCLGLLIYHLTQSGRNKHVLPVKRFLSASMFRPLSRLSFSMYLSHMIPIWFNVYTMKAPFEVNSFNIVSAFNWLLLNLIHLFHLNTRLYLHLESLENPSYCHT